MHCSIESLTGICKTGYCCTPPGNWSWTPACRPGPASSAPAGSAAGGSGSSLARSRRVCSRSVRYVSSVSVVPIGSVSFGFVRFRVVRFKSVSFRLVVFRSVPFGFVRVRSIFFPFHFVFSQPSRKQNKQKKDVRRKGERKGGGFG